MIFINPRENRPRAAWRILITTVLIISLLIFCSLFIRSQIGIMVALAFAVLNALVFSAALLDKRPFFEFGFTLTARWAGDFIAGNVIAVCAMTALVAFQYWAGWLSVNQFNSDVLTAPFLIEITKMFVLMSAVSIWEEAYFRGYLITNLKEGLQFNELKPEYAILFSVCISAILFGLAHASNPNATSLSVINISIAGIVLAYPYIVTGSMAISVGMHLSWNYFQGTVFGLPVSGLDMEETFISSAVSGPDLFTGGLFGPEGGLIGLAGLLVMAVFCYIYLVMFYKK